MNFTPRMQKMMKNVQLLNQAQDMIEVKVCHHFFLHDILIVSSVL